MEIGMVLKVGEWGYELLGIFNWTGQFPVPVVGDEEKVWWVWWAHVKGLRK